MDYNILVNVKTKAPLNTNYTLKQGDYGQKLVITADDYDVVGTTASLILRKPDGNVVERSLTLDNQAYTYKLDSQDTSQPGKVIADIKYYKSGVRDSSASFIFDITGDSIGTLVTSKTYSDALEQALASCKQAIQDVENALLAELNIYNGYDKTTAGYAADVRQLNESIVGTYAEMIKNRLGVLSSLTTATKSNLVAAINELKDKNDTVNNKLADMHEYQKFIFKYIEIASTDGLDSSTNLYYKDIDISEYFSGTRIIAAFACNAYIPAKVDTYVVSTGILNNDNKTIRVYFNKGITSSFSLSILVVGK